MKNLFKKIVVKIITWEARLALRHYGPKIIAITGSVGKTSTKDAIFTVISTKFHARKSEKSFNSDIGVPLAILDLNNAWYNPFKWAGNIFLGFWRIFFAGNYPRVLVLEVGADKPGDIKEIVAWLKPDIAVVTRLADVPVHIANFSSPEQIYKEKSCLVEALGPQGIAVLNADDERVLAMKRKTDSKKILYGISNNADVLGSQPVVNYMNARPTGLSFRIDYQGKSVPFEIQGGLGTGQAYSILAAAAVGLSLGMNVLEVAEAAKNIKFPPGRMKILEGIKNTTIIDDSYNSSPVALESALRTLEEINTEGRKIAALGDMRELGSHSEREHRKAGKRVAEVAEILITVGPESRALVEGALDNRMGEENIYQFEAGEGSREAGEFLQNFLAPGDMVLVKGSQNTIRMERLVEEIMLHPELKKELLVRQDDEWQKM